MTILVTGASRGIGKYLACELAKNNHIVFGTFNSTPYETDQYIQMNKVNISDELEVKNWINKASEQASELVLINSAGVNYNATIHNSDSDRWINVLMINLVGSYYMIKHIVPHMRRLRYGRIILLSSVVAQYGVAGTSAYSASKSALWGLSKAVATENAKYGITVNTINLGYYDIGMINDVPSDLLSKIIEGVPMQHLGTPDNIMATIEYIINADYLTGSQIDINGGLY